MSRIGKFPITIIEKTNITVLGNKITCQGPKGELYLNFSPKIKIEKTQGQIIVKAPKNDKTSKELHGMTRRLIENMVIGVNNGYEKKLELVGVGYRVSLKDKDLEFHLGYSHPITIKAPEGIDFKVQKNIISVLGIDKQLVGLVAAKIRDLRKPEPYKGKGIKYIDEIVRRKAGKTAKTGASEAKK